MSDHSRTCNGDDEGSPCDCDGGEESLRAGLAACSADVARLRAALEAREAEVKYLRAHRECGAATMRDDVKMMNGSVWEAWKAINPEPTPPEGVEP